MAYVNNNDLLEELLKSHRQGSLTQACHDILSNIVKQRINALLVFDKKRHYEPMYNFCMDKMYKTWQKFRFNEENPFAYFYTIIDNRIKLYYAQNCPLDEHGKPLVQFVSIDEGEETFNDKD